MGRPTGSVRRSHGAAPRGAPAFFRRVCRLHRFRRVTVPLCDSVYMCAVSGSAEGRYRAAWGLPQPCTPPLVLHLPCSRAQWPLIRRLAVFCRVYAQFFRFIRQYYYLLCSARSFGGFNALCRRASPCKGKRWAGVGAPMCVCRLPALRSSSSRLVPTHCTENSIHTDCPLNEPHTSSHCCVFVLFVLCV